MAPMIRAWNGSPGGWVTSLLLCAGVLWGSSSVGAGEKNARRRDPGSQAGVVTNRFSITGMHCKDCAKGLSAELRLTPGVVRAMVSLADTEATVVYDTNRVATRAVLKAIEAAGFRGKVFQPDTPKPEAAKTPPVPTTAQPGQVLFP